MNIEQFEDLVDRFGEVPTGWPDDIRADALTFLNRSPKAQEIIAEAAALRGMFGQDDADKAPAGLSNRIFAAAGLDDRQPPSARKDFFPAAHLPHPAVASRGWRPSYVLLASCFVAGLGLGLGLRFAPLGGDGHIDFATLFAVIGS